jgi:hypothetical protein
MRAAVAVACVLLGAPLAWIAGEAHYQGCVAGAVAVTQDVRPAPSISDQIGGVAAPNNRKRIDAVKGCSRLPF